MKGPDLKLFLKKTAFLSFEFNVTSSSYLVLDVDMVGMFMEPSVERKRTHTAVTWVIADNYYVVNVQLNLIDPTADNTCSIGEKQAIAWQLA